MHNKPTLSNDNITYKFVFEKDKFKNIAFILGKMADIVSRN